MTSATPLRTSRRGVRLSVAWQNPVSQRTSRHRSHIPAPAARCPVALAISGRVTTCQIDLTGSGPLKVVNRDTASGDTIPASTLSPVPQMRSCCLHTVGGLLRSPADHAALPRTAALDRQRPTQPRAGHPGQLADVSLAVVVVAVYQGVRYRRDTTAPGAPGSAVAQGWTRSSVAAFKR